MFRNLFVMNGKNGRQTDPDHFANSRRALRRLFITPFAAFIWASNSGS